MSDSDAVRPAGADQLAADQPVRMAGQAAQATAKPAGRGGLAPGNITLTGIREALATADGALAGDSCGDKHDALSGLTELVRTLFGIPAPSLPESGAT